MYIAGKIFLQSSLQRSHVESSGFLEILKQNTTHVGTWDERWGAPDVHGTALSSTIFKRPPTSWAFEAYD